jgi:ABC-2 type transport system permease protein
VSVKIFLKFAQLRMKERLEYRGAFLLGIVAQIIAYGSSYLVVWLLLQRFETIGGWTWPEVALLYSIGLFTYSIGASFTWVQMSGLEELVRNGTFDSVLIKPSNPFMYIVARGFNVAYIAHIIISGSFLIWSLSKLTVQWTPFLVLYFLLILISGAMIQAAIFALQRGSAAVGMGSMAGSVGRTGMPLGGLSHLDVRREQVSGSGGMMSS